MDNFETVQAHATVCMEQNFRARWSHGSARQIRTRHAKLALDRMMKSTDQRDAELRTRLQRSAVRAGMAPASTASATSNATDESKFVTWIAKKVLYKLVSND